MVFGNTIISSTRGDLSPEQVLRLANFYLDNARNEPDPAVVLVLCYDAEISLSHVKRSKYMDNLTTREGMASVYGGFGDLLETHGHHQPAQAFYRKSEKWGSPEQLLGHSDHRNSQLMTLSLTNYPEAVLRSLIDFHSPLNQVKQFHPSNKP
ncbi:hypothetical protein B0O80DRAFT_431416 [Mortierella sp. GBAus27b]|nr:hypothetical protein B0O80DRAFT_431416 [Mortierella sp. GBAus27b]